MKHLMLVPTEEACRIVLQVTRRGTQAELEAASLPAREAWWCDDCKEAQVFASDECWCGGGPTRRVLVVDYPEEAS